MAQSLTELYAHLIFSTKDRMPLIGPAIRPRLHAYLAELMRDHGSSFVVVGGVSDHVHILFDLGKMKSPVSFVERAKRESSRWIKSAEPAQEKFYWQAGYGMFSVSPIHRESVEGYIRNQEEHHRTTTFQEEYRGFLKRYGVEYDERYVWD